MDGFQVRHLFSSFQVFKTREAGMRSARFDYSRKFQSARYFVDNLYADFFLVLFPKFKTFSLARGSYTRQSTRGYSRMRIVKWKTWGMENLTKFREMR